MREMYGRCTGEIGEAHRLAALGALEQVAHGLTLTLTLTLTIQGPPHSLTVTS